MTLPRCDRVDAAGYALGGLIATGVAWWMRQVFRAVYRPV